MRNVRILGNYKDNDVELCRTTNRNAGKESAEALMEARIPFTRNEKKIPFFQRERYNGATQMWVISVNPRRYGQARKALDQLDYFYRERLVLSNY